MSDACPTKPVPLMDRPWRLLRALELDRDGERLHRQGQRLLGRDPDRHVRQARLAARIRHLLEGPDDQLDLCEGALLVAREADPQLAIAPYSERIEVLAIRLRKRLWNRPDPHQRVREMNRFLFEEEGFTATPQPEARQDRRMQHLMLPGVLDGCSGYCTGLSLLYLVLGQRLGLPLYGVALPRHFLVRYDDGRTRMNVEVTQRGRSLPDRYYRERYGVTEEQQEGGIYLNNLSPREVLVELLNNTGNFHYTSGNVRQAVEDLKRVTDARSDHAVGQLGMGFLHQKRGQLLQAVACYQRAVAIDPRLVSAYVNLGATWLELGNLSAAEPPLRAALELDPENALALTNLGHLHTLKGEWPEAQRLHQQALRDPGEHRGRIYNNLAIGHHRAGQHLRAIRALKRAIRQSPRQLMQRENLAKIYRLSGRRWRARLAIRRVIRTYRRRLYRTPSDVSLKAGLARFLLDATDYLGQVAPLVNELLKEQPDSPGFLELKAELRFREKNYPAAIALGLDILDRPAGQLPRPAAHYQAFVDKVRQAWSVLRES